MKLVFFTHGGILYGANLSMIDLIIGLRSRGVQAMVVHAQDGPIRERLRVLGIPSEWIPFAMSVHWRSNKALWNPRRWMSEAANYSRALSKQQFNQQQLPDLLAATRAFGADLTVSNASSTVIGLNVAVELNLPHVWHIREFGDLDWEYYPDGGFRRRRQQLLRSAKVICVSRAVAAHHGNQCGVLDAQFVVLNNSIAGLEELSARANTVKSASGSCPFTFAIIGFVKRSKGQFVAVSALRRLLDQGENVRLVVAGQGSTDELILHALAEGISSRVSVLGHVPDLSEIYQQADCGLMCSEAEGFGRVTAEFMSWGKPVIGRNSGATPEILEDGVNGLLYDGSIKDLVLVMKRLIANPDLQITLGRRASHDAFRCYSHQTTALAFLDHVSPLLSRA
jgi:glycosyltransferase involved in cell wall biosynthesis